MTCIVGLVDAHGSIWIGADSAATNGSSQQVIRRDRKVFVVQQQFLLGCTSSFRMIQLLRYTLHVPPYNGQRDIHEYLSTAFIEAVRDCLKHGGYAKEEIRREEGGTFLVGFRGRLFRVESDYQVEEALIGYNAAGSADDIAKGALYATQHFAIVPEQRIKQALEAASYHNCDVRPPFIIERLEVTSSAECAQDSKAASVSSEI